MDTITQIFLSYARPDENMVEELYEKLSDAGFKVWMDKKDILPGERWRVRIERAIKNSDFFLVCLSKNSVNRRGFLQREIKQALDIWEEKLKDDIYLIPIRLDECNVPDELSEFQWVNLFEENGRRQLVKAIQVGMERRVEDTETGASTELASPSAIATDESKVPRPYPEPKAVPVAAPIRNSFIDNRQISEQSTKLNPRSVFVIYGRNSKARRAVFDFLRSIGLTPLEWEQAIQATGKPTPYLGDVFEAIFSSAQAIVVLLTPDDLVYEREILRVPGDPRYEINPSPQARPNVLFEAGMAMGRHPERTILVELGQLRPFSNIAGRHVIKLNNSITRRKDFALRLQLAGCPVDITGVDWHTVGDFNVALEEFDFARPTETLPSKSLSPGIRLDVRTRHEWLFPHNGERHEYVLIVEVENTGSTRVTDPRVEVLFPKAFMDIESYGFEIHKAETKTHKVLRPPDLQGGLCPGESRIDKTIKYSVDNQRFWNDSLMELPVEVNVYADGMAPQRVKKPIKELQNF